MQALQGQSLNPQAIGMAQQALELDLQPHGDVQADAVTKLHWAKVLLGRALNAIRSAA
jgi:CO/xanthine dehydrogenase FAD-binding subunit